MTVGDPTKHILLFALPILLGNVFQNLYSMVDAAVVGKLIGVEALAAVGSSGWLDWLVLGFIMGLTQGYSIMISQRFGASDISGMKNAVSMSIILTACISVTVMIVSVSLCGTALDLMRTPASSYPLAKQYATVIFLGIPISMSYNLLAGMLRAVGDSRTPLAAMIVASFTNVAFDLLFVAVFRWGVRGAAGATVLGQAVSTVICLIAVIRNEIFRLNRENWHVDFGVIKRLTGLGLPIAGQNLIIAVGGVIMQSIINSFGVIVMAGISAAAKFSGLLETAAMSMGSAMHTFSGQNMGAGRYDRIREGVKKAALIANAVAVVMGALAFIFGRQVLKLFIDMDAESAQAVLDSAYYFLRVLGASLFALYSLQVFRSTLQGLGVAFATIVSSLFQVFMRTAVTYMLTLRFGEKGVYYGDSLAWTAAFLVMMFVYLKKIRVLAPIGTAQR